MKLLKFTDHIGYVRFFRFLFIRSHDLSFFVWIRGTESWKLISDRRANIKLLLRKLERKSKLDMIRISKPKSVSIQAKSATRYKFSTSTKFVSLLSRKKKKSPRYERYTILVSNSRVVFRIEKRIENNRSNYRNSRISSADCFDKYRNACENFRNSHGIGLNEFYAVVRGFEQNTNQFENKNLTR